MARQLRIEFPGAFYHVIQRGIERKNIFTSNQDKDRFLFYLNTSIYRSEPGMETYRNEKGNE